MPVRSGMNRLKTKTISSTLVLGQNVTGRPAPFSLPIETSGVLAELSLPAR
jgi:hypothetical protein